MEGSWYGNFEALDLELLTKSFILHPFTRQFQGFTGVDTGKITDNGGQLLLLFFPEFCDHKVIFFVVVRNSFEKTVNGGHFVYRLCLKEVIR